MRYSLLLALLLVAATSCNASRKQIRRVVANMPEGGIKLLQCAEQAARTYHRISDTSIHELATPAVKKEVGDMITRSRDLYRSTKSYGRLLPDNENLATSENLEEIRGDISEYGYELELTITRSKKDWSIEVSTLRAKPICVLDARAREAIFFEPFLAIVEGDEVVVGSDVEVVIERVRGKWASGRRTNIGRLGTLSPQRPLRRQRVCAVPLFQHFFGSRVKRPRPDGYEVLRRSRLPDGSAHRA